MIRIFLAVAFVNSQQRSKYKNVLLCWKSIDEASPCIIPYDNTVGG